MGIFNEVAKLQWGRDLAVTETGTRPRQSWWRFCSFNGAVTLRSRKRECGRIRQDLGQASMGP